MTKINQKDPNYKEKRQLSPGYQSSNYRKLMRLANDKSLVNLPVETLKLELEAVMNMESVDDPDPKFQKEYNELRAIVVNRLNSLIDSKRKMNLPIVIPEENFFYDDLVERAKKIGKVLNINSDSIIKTIQNNIGLTMDFIKLADNFTRNENNIAAKTDLLDFLSSIGVNVSNFNNIKANFISTLSFLILDYVNQELGVVQEESLKEAMAILEDAFTIPNFEEEVREAYSKFKGEDLIKHLIKLLIQFDVVDDNIKKYI